MTESTPLTTPLTDDVIDALSIGQHVTFTAVLYTARDAAHKRLNEMVGRGEHWLALPIVGVGCGRPSAGYCRPD